MRILLALLISTGCSNAIKQYHKEMEGIGFIPYVTPLQHAGTGTLVGGTPKRLVVATRPDTCFPDIITGKKTDLRFVQETKFPEKFKRMEIGAAFTTSFLEVIGAGSPPISAGAEFEKVKEMQVKFEGATIEIIDTLKLQEFYSRNLHENCKKLLERFGVIVEAARVERMTIEFYKEDKGEISLKSKGAVSALIDFGAEVEWDVEEETKLVITSPKYIGYRIARLQRKDVGVAMVRATRLKRGKFKFEDVGLFKDEGLGQVGKFASVKNVESLQ